MRCKNCKKTILPWQELHILWMSTLCSIKCKEELRKEEIKKEKAKQKEKNKLRIIKDKIRKVKKKEKKHNSISYLTKQLDNLWSQLVKINYNYTCAYCWKKENLNSHHLFSRSKRATRWDLENGITLCCGCHTMSSNFSAHKCPLDFAERIRELKWDDYINELSKKSKEIKQWTSEELLEMIESYKNMLQNLQINN